MKDWTLPEETWLTSEGMKQWLIKQSGIDSDYQTDNVSLVWNNDNHNCKTLLLFRLLPTAAMITKVEKDGCKANFLSDKNPENIKDAICNHGILRVQKEEITFTPFGTLSVGDVCHVMPNLICKDNALYGAQISVLAQLELAANCLKKIKESSTTVSVAIVDETVGGVESVLRLIETQKPESLIICTPAKAEKEFSIGQGVGVGIKDGNWVAQRELRERMMNTENQSQPFIGSTGTTLARCYIAVKSKQMMGFYLPVGMMGMNVEEICKNDMTMTQNLLLKCVETFDIIEK